MASFTIVTKRAHSLRVKVTASTHGCFAFGLAGRLGSFVMGQASPVPLGLIIQPSSDAAVRRARRRVVDLDFNNLLANERTTAFNIKIAQVK
jgi:hypothetical protein